MEKGEVLKIRELLINYEKEKEKIRKDCVTAKEQADSNCRAAILKENDADVEHRAVFLTKLLLNYRRSIHFIVFNGNIARAQSQRTHKNYRTADDTRRIFNHKAVICADVRLTLTAVDYHRVYLARR